MNRLKDIHTFLDYHHRSSRKIDKSLQQYLDELEGKYIQEYPHLKKIIKLFSDRMTGGKIIRGTLTQLGFEMISGKKSNKILWPACAIEILHSSLLILDDLIDKSPLRRGQVTIHTQLGNDHYATSQTVGIGSFGQHLAYSLILRSKISSRDKERILKLFSKTVMNTWIGEMLDVELPQIKLQRKEIDVLTIHRLKTAYYSIVNPLSLGALIAGTTDRKINQIAKFGEKLGIAFQIVDDLLGVFGDEQKIGKSVSSDILEGKNTLLITYALEKGTTKDRLILERLYGNQKISLQDVENIKQIFINTGALTYSKEQAQNYITQAKMLIPTLTNKRYYQTLLNGLCEFLIERNT